MLQDGGEPLKAQSRKQVLGEGRSSAKCPSGVYYDLEFAVWESSTAGIRDTAVASR